MNNNFTIRTATWQDDKDQLLTVRHSVFVDEQSVPLELEVDEHDETACHWLVYDKNNAPIATGRMLPDGQIGRMAVMRIHRGKKIGHQLLSTILAYAEQQKLADVYLSSQIHAIDFYRKLGFVAEGEQYMDAGIAHVRMHKRLNGRRTLGEHGGNFSVSNLKQTAIEMVAQTQRSLKILSYDLDHEVFDNETMADLISALARKSRHTYVQLLVVDTSAMIKRSHRLLTLQRRLSSGIGLKTVSCNPNDVKENLILADNLGIICQSIRDNEKMWANFNNRPITSNYVAQFDDLWNRAVEDKNIRPLDI